jgi:hypothetical protein
VRGVGALLASGLHQPALAEALQHAVEQKLLGVASEQAGAELAQDGEIEAGVGQLQTERILPVDSRPHGFGRLAVGEVLEELHHGDQRQPPGRQARLAPRGEELCEITILVQDSKLVPKPQIDVALGKCCTRNTGGFFRDRRNGSRLQPGIFTRRLVDS